MAPERPAHVDDPVLVGERLRAARESAGLSQAALAAVGCTAAYVSRVEAGRRTPSVQLLRGFAALLGVTESFLAWGEEVVDESQEQLAAAEVALRLDDTEVAEAIYDDLRIGADSASVRSRALAGLGLIASRRGKIDETITLLEQALEELKPPQLSFATYADSLGRAYAVTAQYESAIGLFETYLGLARSAEDGVEILRFEVLLANTFIDSGAFTKAEAILGATIARLGATADPLSIARLYWSQSRLHSMQRRPEVAAQFARRALHTLEATEHTFYLARAHHLLAQLELDQGRHAEARELLERGRSLMGRSGSELDQAKFLFEEAQVFLQAGELEQARELAAEAAMIFEGRNPYGAGRSRKLIGDALRAETRLEDAVAQYELALDYLPPNASRYRVEALTSLSEVLEELGEPTRAFDTLKQAMALQKDAGRPLV